MRLPLPLSSVASFCLVVPATLSAQTYAPGQGPAVVREAIGFGTAVAVAGNEILIGRPGVVPGFPMPPASAGGVQVYRRGSGGRWLQVGVVTAKGLKIDAAFGHALATDGKLLAVGAPAAEDRRGAVYIFERDPSGRWIERAKLTTSDAAAGDRFGRSLALQGGVLLVGSPGHAESQGRVVVFRQGRAPDVWTQQGTLVGSTANKGERFGTSVSLAGDRALIGAPGEIAIGGGSATGNPGRALLFRSTGTRLDEGGDPRGRRCTRHGSRRPARGGCGLRRRSGERQCRRSGARVQAGWLRMGAGKSSCGGLAGASSPVRPGARS